MVGRASDVYCPRGEFVPEDMLANIGAIYEQACADNFPASRAAVEMSWALNTMPGIERLMEYEAKANVVFKQYPLTAMCQYDASRFDGATILECLKVHPYMVVRGQVLRNPYYLQPEEYLKALG
jgi:hypothetical protein